MRGAPPSTRSRERFPTSASGRTGAKSTARDRRRNRGECKRCCEARQRRGEGDGGRMRVPNEIRPPARADGREPLVEGEPHRPREKLVVSVARPFEDPLRCEVRARTQPIGEQHAEERNEERAEE